MTSTAHTYKDKDGNVKWIEWRNKKGLLHRENGPAMERASGSKEWYINGLLHRENGPAVERGNGLKQWWLNGRRHRENGPALECADGSVGYYINGQSSPEIEQQIKENMARIQAQKEQQELLGVLCQDHDISAKIKTSSLKISKKL